jgi:threonine aldolase
MARVDRRQFVRIGGLASGIAAGLPGVAFGAAIDDRADRTVRLSGDGLGLTPSQHAGLLNQLVQATGFAPDSYSIGGIVEQLENECARVLGKERAIFMPTGTLANHMAVRALAGGSSRVIVQEESHFYQDEGDCAQTLSALTLIPLAAGRATFSADDVQRVIDQTKAGRVVPRVSVISIESPVRRAQGARFDPVELTKIVALARREGIRLHLDGARLFLQAAYTGESVADYARPFDTVYVSLYKYFNAASGAMLAGPRELLDGMYHGRRMFGGGLNHVWPFALVARHYLDGFGDRFSHAVRTSEEWMRALGRHGAFTIDRVPSGTNLFRLRVSGTEPASLQRRLASAGVMLAPPQDGAFLIGVNETLNRTSAADLTDAFVRAVAG